MTASQQKNKRDRRALTIGFILILFVGVYFIGKSFFWTHSDVSETPASSAVDNEAKAAPLIAPDVLLQKIQNGDKIVIVDVRTTALFATEHIAHSISLPIGSLQNFSPNKDESIVIVFSEADLQTFETAKNILAQKSFPYFFLKGGFEGWQNIHAPTISIGDPNSFIDQSKITYIELEPFKKLLNEKEPSLFILDIQTEENYKKKHIVGATNIPLGELEKRSDEIPAGKQIVIYGENDNISFLGGVRLSDLGIFAVQTLIGNKYLASDSGVPFESEKK